jgi:hypothetical protein
MGDMSDSTIVRSVLVPLLDHDDPLVVEGVFLGLSNHLNDDVKARLKEMSSTHKITMIREMAAEMLED